MPYELHEPIGEGGMAVVYRASADDGTSVALKVIKTDLLEPRMVQRFVREARVVRELSHPGIVRCVDAGQMPDGRPFIAYEWLQGSTLAEHGPATTRQAVHIGGQILDALSHAHTSGLVHRDITPRNIVLVDTVTKVIDFGLVASLAGSVDMETWTRLTKTGCVVGTPPYMAPEQVEGEEVSAQTDLWAVGAVLYWLVSGHELFPAKTPSLRMLKTVSENPKPISVLAPHVHPSLSEVLMRALSRDPTERHASATEMAEELRGVEVSDTTPEPTGTSEISPTR